MSNFICDRCGMTNIDCGKQGYKTEREIELEKQLDREIHINRKMKKALEVYANSNHWIVSTEFDGYCVFLYKPNSNGYEIAQQTLKQIEEME